MKLDTTSAKKSSKSNTSQSEKPSVAKTEELINVHKNEPNLFELESLDGNGLLLFLKLNKKE